MNNSKIQQPDIQKVNSKPRVRQAWDLILSSPSSSLCDFRQGSISASYFPHLYDTDLTHLLSVSINFIYVNYLILCLTQSCTIIALFMLKGNVFPFPLANLYSTEHYLCTVCIIIIHRYLLQPVPMPLTYYLPLCSHSTGRAEPGTGLDPATRPGAVPLLQPRWPPHGLLWCQESLSGKSRIREFPISCHSWESCRPNTFFQSHTVF